MPEAGYRRVWAAVMLSAVTDLRSKSPNARSSALVWFDSDRVGPGSLRFACRMLELDVGSVRNRLGRSIVAARRRSGRVGNPESDNRAIETQP